MHLSKKAAWQPPSFYEHDPYRVYKGDSVRFMLRETRGRLGEVSGAGCEIGCVPTLRYVLLHS